MRHLELRIARWRMRGEGAAAFQWVMVSDHGFPPITAIRIVAGALRA